MDIQWPNQTEIWELNRLFGFNATGYEQDWGIEFSDETRAEEFFLSYVNNELSIPQKMSVMQLILASFDELMYTGQDNKKLWQQIANALVNEASIHMHTIEYWCCDGETNKENMFPTTPRMREVASAL
ncbi:hypothetical protein [Arsukibacterium sp.]|uniref:hypothetical protein n=1 Tax=Arsukibacterium sp. TaxID=1977258 RepID=UPI00299E2E08|nr:hypothetical protein [Arsukibacterium sp.]MDX1538358.1 hypothetical protein [Arsukibacterium sp.]